MKNYQYVLDIETPFIRKLYDKENNYKVELLTPYGILEELKKLQEENADLEAKLAESESCAGMLHHHLTDKVIEIEMLGEEIDELKQQLAEKENFIEDLMTGRVKPVIPRIKEIKKQYQDKISFAVEQLENCRLNLIKLLNKKRVYLDSSTTDEMDDLFDNQIKQLKEMK